MSFVNLLAAERPMPLGDWRTQRTVVLGPACSIEGEQGFMVEPCDWYPGDMAHCETLPYQYNMELAEDQQTFADLTAYLRENLKPGEKIQLWQLFLGGLDGKPQRYRGKLADFDQETFSLLFGNDECCITVER